MQECDQVAGGHALGAHRLAAIALGGPWAMGWHMAWQLRGLDTKDNAKLLQLFRANRDTGMIPLLFFAASLLA